MPPARKRGSPLESSSSTERRFRVGRLGRPHGLRGLLGLYVEDEDLELLQPGTMVYIADSPHTVDSVTGSGKSRLIGFTEVRARDQAEHIRGLEIYAAGRRELAPGEYWPEDLVGLQVRPGGGSVVGLVHGPAQARLVIERGPSTFEVPFVTELVPLVDLDEGYLEIAELPGLIEPSG